MEKKGLIQIFQIGMFQMLMNMSHMFRQASDFARHLSSWNVSSVVNMEFYV